MNNAIVCLTRGYDKESKYNKLIQRNNSIFHFFGTKYPIIIFHEGNIPQNHQEYICSQHDELKFEFINVNEIFQGDGYKSMCRFNMYYIWEYCKNYDYILRIDEDCLISKVINGDPFDRINDYVYLKSTNHPEAHSETNATLPRFIQNLTGVNPDQFYDHKFPYTNVGLASVKFFREEKINNILKTIATSPEQIDNRWGDLPVLGSLLNVYAKDKIGILGIDYFHESHNIFVKGDE